MIGFILYVGQNNMNIIWKQSANMKLFLQIGTFGFNYLAGGGRVPLFLVWAAKFDTGIPPFLYKCLHISIAHKKLQ